MGSSLGRTCRKVKPAGSRGGLKRDQVLRMPVSPRSQLSLSRDLYYHEPITFLFLLNPV